MNDAHDFLRTLAVVLGVAAVTTVVFQRLKQPVVFGYLLAGIIIGPYLPIPIAADAATVRTLAELGVILLLFGLGLEFSIRKLISSGPTAGVVAVTQSALMVWIGFELGRAFGWTTLERFYAGAIIAISSTTIIAKAFEEQRVTGKFRELVLGVLIIEDLIGIFLIAILTTVSSGADISAGTLASTGLRLALFLAALIGVGLLVVPRVVRFIVRMDRPETTLIASIGICFIAALLALSFDYSVALGAFIAGSLIAESGHEKLVEHLVQPVRDVFAAIFFVSVGMLINPALVAEHWVAVLAFTAAVILGKVIAVTIGAFAVGFSPRTAVQAGMSLAQIGEFSFIIAGVGLATGATRDFLYPIAVAVSAITTLTTPWLIRSSGAVASYVDRSLPGPLQTFVSLYGSWMDRLRSARPLGSRSRSRRLMGLLLLDTALIIIVIIGTSLELGVFSRVIGEWTGLTPQTSRLTVLGAAAIVLAPLLIGLVRTAGQLAVSMALAALPAPSKGVDFAASPRRALVVTLQLALVLAITISIALMTQPFVPVFRSVLTTGVGLAAFIVIAGVALWRTASDLHGHARAGAEIIVSALAGQMATPSDGRANDPDHALRRLHDMLPGLGDPSPVRIEHGSAADGRTLAEVDLRGQTGAAVLAIMRDGHPVLMPGVNEVLRVGDVLAVVGSREAIDDTKLLLAPK